jgi:hypothetical protein
MKFLKTITYVIFNSLLDLLQSKENIQGQNKLRKIKFGWKHIREVVRKGIMKNCYMKENIYIGTGI